LFNKIDSIHEGDYSYNIKYYPNKNQAISLLTEKGDTISHKQYAGKAFEIDIDKKYFYVYAYGQPVAVFIQEGEGEPHPYYIHTDHLGSIDVITDEYGEIVDSMSFDAWGNRRDRNDWSQKEDANVEHLIDRGFTDHQMLDVFNLINMGGRVYDPVTAQFLSPDPYVQAPDNVQNLNRYSYCLFNPMNLIDPTGEDWYRLGKGTPVHVPGTSERKVIICGEIYEYIGETVWILYGNSVIYGDENGYFVLSGVEVIEPIWGLFFITKCKGIIFQRTFKNFGFFGNSQCKNNSKRMSFFRQRN